MAILHRRFLLERCCKITFEAKPGLAEAVCPHVDTVSRIGLNSAVAVGG